jgi:hypothetical protein
MPISDALAGVIIGGVIGLTTALALEMMRAFRESRFRHVADKREAYAAFLRASEHVVDDAREQMEANARGETLVVAERDDYYLAFERLELIGSIPAVAAMRKMHTAVLGTKLFGTNAYGSASDEAWLKAVEEYWRRREEFVQAARRDLGVEVRTRPSRPTFRRRRVWQRLRLTRRRPASKTPD